MIKHVKNILFDLDGTLTDSAYGIANCFRYTLERLGVAELSEAELLSFVGPPLHTTFATILRTSDPVLVAQAVALYRERFDAVGWRENSVYEGVVDAFKADGYELFVATSKDETAAQKILTFFRLDHYFKEIAGSDPHGRLANKSTLISELLWRHRLAANETVMIGDRMHDVHAAKQNGVLSIGVTYGYGSLAELREAGADYICDNLPAVVTAVRGFVPHAELAMEQSAPSVAPVLSA